MKNMFWDAKGSIRVKKMLFWDACWYTIYITYIVHLLWSYDNNNNSTQTSNHVLSVLMNSTTWIKLRHSVLLYRGRYINRSSALSSISCLFTLLHNIIYMFKSLSRVSTMFLCRYYYNSNVVVSNLILSSLSHIQ